VRKLRTILVLIVLLAAAAAAAQPVAEPAADPLPAWRDGEVKTAILAWLEAVTDPDDPDFIPVPERIAVLDNDGTSWCERPLDAAGRFRNDLVSSLAARGVIDGSAMPYRAWSAGDHGALRDYGWEKAYAEMNAAFAGMPVTAFRDSARAWLARTTHPRYGVTYDRLYYAPMLQLMDVLGDRGFQVWIVTGGNQDFVRSYCEPVLGIPPEHIIGTTTPPVYRVEKDGSVTLVRGAGQVANGHEHKPENIEVRIGRRPVFAAGNSNNDEPMCRYALTGAHRGLALWIHHDDKDREYAYGRPGDLGKLCKRNPGAWEVSMKRAWAEVFPAGTTP